jgi:RHS repeat-associated protein
LDLNTGLTQVLYDGTTTYTYGLGRIAQTDTTTEYFLSDALGSVRQMTDQAGAITFAQTYDPYGTVASTSGLSHTDYGFTGEQYSASTQMLYLRARYYSPAEGRFQSRDTWSGDANRPLSMNRWGYVEGNPVTYSDPEGYSKCYHSDNPVCEKSAMTLKNYGENIKRRVENGTLLPVEGFAQFADIAYTIFERDISDTLWAMTITINGMDANAGSVWKQTREGYGLSAKFDMGENWLPYENDISKNVENWNGTGGKKSVWVHSRRGDWNINYWDKTANQAYHFWFFVAVGAFDGAIHSNGGNIYHEIFQQHALKEWQTTEEIINLGDGEAPRWRGVSEPDWNLSMAGIRLGNYYGNILADLKYMDCNDALFSPYTQSVIPPGSWIRSNLKEH